MSGSKKRDIAFARLTEVPLDEIVRHMSDARVVEHMPLATFEWNRETAAKFVAAKEECWRRDGLGHWAIVCDGAYVGWGGFQKEGEEWDFGLVLKPRSFGLGPAVADKALSFARSDPRIPYVTFLLPLSRRNLGALEKFGAAPVGEVEYAGARFRKFRLATP